MNVVIVSESDTAGAGRASYRLHQGLCDIGTNSQMVVQVKRSGSPTVLTPQNRMSSIIAKTRVRGHLDALPLSLSRNRPKPKPYSLQWLPGFVSDRVNNLKPDIVNLHWVNFGYFRLEAIAKIKAPIVWTLHDMWALTGGCHYSGQCDGYKFSCGKCPPLSSNREWDLSRWVWQRKSKAWQNTNFTIVAPSNWLAKCAQNSSLFQGSRIEVIPNGLDITKYKPVNRQEARQWLGLPSDKKLLLFGAVNALSDARKGFDLLKRALTDLSHSEWGNRLELLVFGSDNPSELADLPLKSHCIGKLSDDIALALIYAAADAFIAPSREDNLPNTVMEALACGTPCVAFDIGGMADMIEHEGNGFLARPFEIEDLSKGVTWILENEERHQRLGQQARKKVEAEFSYERQAKQYLSLFKDLT